jgi:hypothetical protein
MKLYNISKLKPSFMQVNPQIESMELQKFFGPQSIFNSLDIKKVYIQSQLKSSKSSKQIGSYIDEEDLEKICLLAKLKLNGNFDTKILKGFEITEDYDLKKVNDYDSYKEVIAEYYRDPVRIEKHRLQKEKENENKIHNQSFAVNADNCDIDVTNKKVVAIDFEYDGNRLSYNGYSMKFCSECGISILENNEIKNYHYYITDGSHKTGIARHLVDKFEFGTTQYVTSEELISILNKVFHDADYFLAHGMETEYTIVTKNNIDLHKGNMELLDTYRMFSKLDEDKVLKSYRLKDIMRTCNMNTENVHNAGNDAAYTLMTFMQMNYNKEKVISEIKKLAVHYDETKLSRRSNLIKNF